MSKQTIADSLLVIIDGGSGLTIQCEGYTHSYEGWSNEVIAEQGAKDIMLILDGYDPREWEGNEPEATWDTGALDGNDVDVFSASEIRNIISGYTVIYLEHPGRHGGHMGMALWWALLELTRDRPK